MIKKLPVVLLMAWPYFSQAQGFKEAQISLSGSFAKPLEIEAINKGQEIDFFCVNKSFFPYQLEIIFSGVQNLNGPRSQKSTVMPGRQRLLSLQIQDPNTPHTYEYSFGYAMGSPKANPDLSYPYLVPASHGAEARINESYNNQLLLNPKDYIVAMRRGVVTSTPDVKGESDRLFNGAFEVLHEDGTVAVYKTVASNTTQLVKSGDKIYPGQPIGQSQGGGILTYNVYILLGQGRAKSFDHNVVVSSDGLTRLAAFKGCKVEHPATVIEKELSKKEIKKFRDGSLFKQN